MHVMDVGTLPEDMIQEAGLHKRDPDLTKSTMIKLNLNSLPGPESHLGHLGPVVIILACEVLEPP